MSNINQVSKQPEMTEDVSKLTKQSVEKALVAAKAARPSKSAKMTAGMEQVRKKLGQPDNAAAKAYMDMVDVKTFGQIGAGFAPEVPESEADALVTLAINAEVLTGSDSVFSLKDLKKIAIENKFPRGLDDGAKYVVKKAATYMVNNPEAFNALDTAGKGGRRDTKVSAKDLKQRIEQLPLSIDDINAIDALNGAWKDLSGKDGTVSLADLEKLTGGSPPSYATRDMIRAAVHVRKNVNLAYRLDTAKKGNVQDGKISTDDINIMVEKARSQRTALNANPPAIATINSEKSPLSTLTIKGDSSSNAISVVGGVWPARGNGREAITEQLVGLVGASPQISDGNLERAASLAERMTRGESVLDLQEDEDLGPLAIEEAFEVLGISNRQLTLYAEAAVGGDKKDVPLKTLQTALRMRASVTGDGAAQVSDVERSGLRITDLPYIATDDGYVVIDKGGKDFGDDEVTVRGAFRAVETGVRRVRNFKPENRAKALMFGTPLTPGAFNRGSQEDIDKGVAAGAKRLSASAVLEGADKNTGVSLQPFREAAVTNLVDLQGTKSWTTKKINLMLDSTVTLIATVAPKAGMKFLEWQEANGGPDVVHSVAVLTKARNDAMNGALADAGITEVDTSSLSLLHASAANSETFRSMIKGNDAFANRVYEIMGAANTQTIPAINVLQRAQIPGNARYRRLLGEVFNGMKNTPIPSPDAPLTSDEEKSAVITAVQWGFTIARYSLASLGKGQTAAKKTVDATIKKVEELFTLMNSEGVLTTTPDGDTLMNYNGNVFEWNTDGILKYIKDNTSIIGTNETFDFIENVFSKAKSVVNQYGLPAIGALGTMVSRVTRLSTGENMDSVTKGQTIAGIFGDLATMAEILVTDPRFLAKNFPRIISATEDSAVAKFDNLKTWLNIAKPPEGFYAGFSYGLPIAGFEDIPETSVGRFALGLVNKGSDFLKNAGAVGNAIYGVSNIAQSIKAISENAPIKAIVTGALGTIDTVNAVQQFSAALSNRPGSRATTLGGVYPLWAQFGTRIIAAGFSFAGFASAIRKSTGNPLPP